MRLKNLSGFKRFKYNSVFLRYFLFVTAFVILLSGLLIGLFTYQIRRNITEEIYDMNYKELERAADTLDMVVEQIESFSYYMSVENDMKLLMLESLESGFLERAERLSERIKSFEKTFDYVRRAAVYIESRDLLIENGNIIKSKAESEQWMSLCGEAGDRIYYWDTRIAERGYPVILSLVRPIRDTKGEVLGAVIVEIDLDQLNTSIGRSSKDLQCIYMVDQKGEIYYANNIMEVLYPERRPEIIQQYCENLSMDIGQIAESKQMILITVPSQKQGITYVMLTPNRSYEKMMNVKDWLVVVSIGTVALGIILSYVLAIRSYRPIQYILNETAEEGEIRDAFVTGENVKNEIQFITECIRNARRKSAQLSIETSDWIKQLSNAQLQALQSQINPHFLYNTIDAINWMILGRTKGAPDPASDAMSTLAQLLRISMVRSSYLVTLKEEITHAKLYLKLMNIRYEGRIQVLWEIPEKLQEEKILRLCLQPILENSIFHGFAKKRGRGTICISGEITCEALVLRVVDDGVGLSEDACRDLNQELISNYETLDNHVGIRNVNQRIRILFGEKYGVQVAPSEKKGLMVVLEFPKNNN